MERLELEKQVDDMIEAADIAIHAIMNEILERIRGGEQNEHTQTG